MTTRLDRSLRLLGAPWCFLVSVTSWPGGKELIRWTSMLENLGKDFKPYEASVAELPCTPSAKVRAPCIIEISIMESCGLPRHR